MAWFKRQSAGIKTNRDDRNETPEGYWLKCPSCGTITSQHELEEHLLVCPSCGHHYPMSGLGYLRLLFDQGAYTRWDDGLHSVDPLDFVDRKTYPERIEAADRKTGLNDAAVSGTGLVGGHPTSIAAMDFSYIGGSMGSVVGETIARAVRRAADEGRACLVISQSGGARMMEGALSLMQMAKTSANLAVLAERGLPFVSLMTHPTTGGVTASFAMLGDLNLAEPGALIGFAGPRVIRETIGRDLPPDFQTAEFLVEQGFVDRIVPRGELKGTLSHVFDLLMEGDGERAPQTGLPATDEVDAPAEPAPVSRG